MDKFRKKFTDIDQKHPEWSTYTCFINAIRGGRISDENVEILFNELVNKSDYSKTDRKQVLVYLVSQTKKS